MICLLEKLGLQLQPSVGKSVGTSVGTSVGKSVGTSVGTFVGASVSAAAGPLSGKPDMKSNEAQVVGWIHEFCCYKHPVSRMSLTIYMYKCMVPLDRSYSYRQFSF